MASAIPIVTPNYVNTGHSENRSLSFFRPTNAGGEMTSQDENDNKNEAKIGIAVNTATKRTASPIIMKPKRPSPSLVGCRRRREGDAAALAVTAAAPVMDDISSPPSPDRSATRRGPPWRH